MRIEASEKSLQEILSGTNCFSVPDYQRNYAWKADQIDAFMGDLFGLTSDPNDQHFFGPVVVLDGEKGDLSLIDGQQRLTTTIMVLCLIRDKLETFADDEVTINGNKIHLSANYITQLLKLDDFATDRYQANYQIRKIFSEYVLAPPGSPNRKHLTSNGKGMSDQEKSVTRELRSAYKRLDNTLLSWLQPYAGDEQTMKEQILELLLAMRSRFRVLEIRMYSEDDAYILFETLNERGLRLTPSDLLKSFTLRKAKEDKAANIDQVLSTWDAALAQLGDFPFTKFLRHYLLSKQTGKVQAKNIFKLFSEIVKNYGTGGAVKNLKEIERASGVYSGLLTAKFGDPAIDTVLERIELFSDTHRVFLLRVLGTQAPVDVLRRAVRATEIVAFRWILTGGNAQVLENAYQVAANLVNDNDPQSVTTATDNLMTQLPSDNQVRSSIIDGAAKTELRQYVLNRLNHAVTGVGLPFNPAKVHVEHLAPQSPDDKSNWFDRVAPRVAPDANTSTYEDYVSRWGNMSLLEFEINTSIQNAEWDLKLAGQPQNIYKGLIDSNIQLTKDVCHVAEWNAAAIDARTVWVADSVAALTTGSVVDGNSPTIASFKIS